MTTTHLPVNIGNFTQQEEPLLIQLAPMLIQSATDVVHKQSLSKWLLQIDEAVRLSTEPNALDVKIPLTWFVLLPGLFDLELKPGQSHPVIPQAWHR